MRVLAVDGGNSKTDVALLDGPGTLLAWVRGPGCALAPDAVAALIARLASAAAASAGVDSLSATHAACYLAGVDVPWQAADRREALASLGLFGSVEVANDAWALLRLGTSGGPAVAVVCGAGLKCVARSGAGEREYPSLGWQTGDLSGAGDFLARETIRVTARAEDGRGPSTALRAEVLATLDVPSIRAVGEALLSGSLTEESLSVLVPVLLDRALAGDPVASGVVGELAREVATMARTARRSLPDPGPWTLVLGGGLFADPAGRFTTALRTLEPALEREFTWSVVDAPPVAGAALLGLDTVGASVPSDAIRRAFRTGRPATGLV
jgi:N-acetylglucosamine kinase-like BadF-type ATPase